MSSATLISGYGTQEDVFKFSTADNEIVLACIGDFGSADANETLVANLVKSWNPDAVFTAGDNTYTSGANFTTDVDADYGDLVDRKVFFPCPGNHDYTEDATGYPKNYFAYFTDTVANRYYYSKQLGPVTLFMLDSNAATPDGNTSTSAQASWLSSALSVSRSPWNIVVLHHCPYSSGSFHGSVSDLQWGFSGADLVIAGHEHNYERLLVSSIYYIVNGLGGKSKYSFGTALSTSQKRYNTLFGAGKVIATPTKLVWKFYSYDGALVDSLTQEK